MGNKEREEIRKVIREMRKDVQTVKADVKKLRKDLDGHFDRHLRAVKRRKQAKA